MGFLGKLFGRSVVREQAQPPSAPPAVAAGTSHEQILAFLRAAMVEVAAAHGREMVAEELDPHRVLYDSGYIDAMNVLEFLTKIERAYAVSIPDYTIGDHARTLDALAAYVGKQLKSS